MMKTNTKSFWPVRAVSCALLLATQMAAPAASLVSRYSFNESSGTSAADSIGGYTATLNGGTSFDGAGKVALNGTGSYVSLPPAQLSGLTAVTIDAWLSFTVPNNNICLFSVDDGSGTGSGGTYLRHVLFDSGNGHGGTNFLESLVGWGGNQLHGGSVLPTNNTQIHLTLVYDPVSGVESIYLNGVLSATYSGTLPALSSFPQTVFNLGRSPWWSFGDPYLKGSINEFRVYNGVLSGSEIAASDTAGPDVIGGIGVGNASISPSNTLYAGETAILTCGVSGPATGQYWEWDNGSGGATFTRIGGANSLSYTQNSTGLLGAYQYRLVATNASSSATGGVATLTISAATIPFIVTDTTPASWSGYTGGAVTFNAAFDGNHPIAYQWQVDKGSGYTNILGATNTSLALINLQFSDAGSYQLTATNSIGGTVSTAAGLIVNDAVLAKYQWQPPVPFNSLNADQILTNVSGQFIGAAAFGNTAYQVTLGNGRILNFSTDSSIASATGNGTATGAYPAGTGLSTSNANFNAVLNGFAWDGGPKTINLYNLQIGEQYSVQIFAVDNRNQGGGESNRLANYQDPSDPGDVSATFKMGDNVYVIGTFYASNSIETIQMNLLTGNNGSINALVLRALSFTPANQPPIITQNPASKTVFAGHPAQFTVAADSYVIPTYQWQAGLVGGPYTNLNNGGVVSGATSNILTLNPANSYNGAEFFCTVANPAGSAPSTTATLSIVAVPPTSGEASTNVLALNPVAYWPLNETQDPSSGSAGVYDAAGTHDGTYLALAQNAFNSIVGVQAADGYPDFAANQGALRSTGNTDQSWATVPALDLNTNTVTMGMWIYPDGEQANSVGLFVNRNSGTQAGLGYYGTDRLGYKWNNDASATWSFNSGLLIPTNVWSYVAMTITPTNATLYLYNSSNGLQTAINTTPHNNQSWGGSQANIRIGMDNSVARTFNGKIDEVAVFNRALTQAEVLQAAGVVVAPTLSIQPVGSQIQLTWSAGTLLEANTVNGPWTTNVNTSPYLFTPTGPQKFYRVQAQ
jgi:hypothetical protein